jgi:hypothetical protein
MDITKEPISLGYHRKRGQLKVRDVFSSLETFKQAVTNLRIYQKWEFQVEGSNQSQIRLKCLHASPSELVNGERIAVIRASSMLG